MSDTRLPAVLDSSLAHAAIFLHLGNRLVMKTLVGLIPMLVAVYAHGGEISLDIGPFSTSSPGGVLPEGWQAQTFKKIERHTTYDLVKDGDTTVVKATANASASGLTKPLDLDLKDFPILEWRWKVANVVTKGDPKSKAGDDYPARIYLTFKYDPTRVSAWQRAKFGLAKSLYGSYPPHAGINYIWEAKLPIGSVIPNAYTDRLRMIVVESGTEKLNEWQSYRRNVFEDYKKAFGEEPPRVSGIAIMTDTDNTGQAATAFYGDIRLRKSE
jgi:Protein of unknown function (DUF3047)